MHDAIDVDDLVQHLLEAARPVVAGPAGRVVVIAIRVAERWALLQVARRFVERLVDGLLQLVLRAGVRHDADRGGGTGGEQRERQDDLEPQAHELRTV